MNCIDHGTRGNPKGYARAEFQGRVTLKHRKVYCQHHGIDFSTIIGKVIRHTCDNPRCINPEHLLVGTHQDNMNDRTERGRTATGEVNGNSALSNADAALMRSMYVKGSKEFGTTGLARRFGVARSAAWYVVTNRTHKE